MSPREPIGLYDPSHDRDACGLGFVVELKRGACHDVVEDGIEVLKRLAHRGAVGADPLSGDGAGLLLDIPHAFFRAVCPFELPEPGAYGVMMTFLARDPDRQKLHQSLVERACVHHGQRLIGWRDVPVNPGVTGPVARESMPTIRQAFIGRTCHQSEFERRLFMIRKRAGRTAGSDDFYVASCSSRTIIYKGLFLPEHADAFYPDLRDGRFASRIAIVHSRFSTNTFPTWDRAHPFRRIAHNGEINTIRSNRHWMSAREQMLEHPLFGKFLKDFRPIVRPGGSDSSTMDNVIDLLVNGGRSIAHVMMMLVPEAIDMDRMSPTRRAFFDYHACLMEPWDGPAALVFTDGRFVGAMLDRNGLRPLKYITTRRGRIVASSEYGVVDVAPEDVQRKGRVKPGQMLLVDVDEKRIIDDQEIKETIAGRRQYGEWLRENKIQVSRLPPAPAVHVIGDDERDRLLAQFGYTREELRVVMAPMARAGQEPVGSMGNDTPLAVLSDRPQLLSRYFKQQFAQVTNPAIDPIRESLVMSLVITLGGEGNLLDETPEQCRLLELDSPVLSNAQMAQLTNNPYPYFRSKTLSLRFWAHDAPGSALERALETLGDEAERAVDEGYSVLVMSDRELDRDHAAIPCLLATSAVHHRLLRRGKRSRVGLIVESGEPREVNDFAVLIAYGAGAVNPYLALDLVDAMREAPIWGVSIDAEDAQANYVNAIEKGLLKVLSKMGISTISSYRGAQLYEALGLSERVVERYFTGTTSAIGGIDLDLIARESLDRHRKAYSANLAPADPGGVYAFREHGERHMWTPRTIATLQRAVRLTDEGAYAEFARTINEQKDRYCTIRSLWEIVAMRPPVPIDKIEPASEIVKRFVTGAMSFGSISQEAHETLAVAMNRIGARSNSGEGGEDPRRFVPDEHGDLRRSAIKQVASARFGVTAHYLVNADDIQIKIAQGAKPGEGGQLPGHKVDAIIARVRNSTPGVTLISPPPHHDIYSIEDLKQLIYDLKNVNPRARVSVKLVAESGVGTIAAGVVKAHADAVIIAGYDGGTGASPLSSIQHAGVPWEIGLAETQQVLMLNRLRDRVRLQVDGQMRTGRDVAIAALLGAEEFGFATAPLVTLGCVMMRKCHLNTCPVGIATQDPVLRERFNGEPEYLIRYLFYVAEELREIMSRVGFRSVDEMVGRVECLVPRHDVTHAKAATLDFSKVLARPAEGGARSCTHAQPLDLDGVLDHDLINRAQPALVGGGRVEIEVRTRNSDRALGAMLSGEVARRTAGEGFADDTIVVRCRGTAGQSFGAFAVQGVSLLLEGDANDYVGKGLSGGVLALRPPAKTTFAWHDNALVGNTVLYGAISGRAFFAGRAGERFAVRNSGATAVVEGVGDHGCEYMTGGAVVVLGDTGRNFAAGMSGGFAWVLDEDGTFERRVNAQMVDAEEAPVSDEAYVKAIVEEHVMRTTSPRAKELLSNWAAIWPLFKKVVPREYRRVLQERRSQAEERDCG